MHENAELDVCAPVHLLIPVTQPRREACVFFSLGQTKGAYTHRRSTHLEDDSEYARKQDHEEQLVAKLGARLEVDSPISPRVESQSDKIMRRSTEKDSRIEVCDCADHPNASVLGRVPEDDRCIVPRATHPSTIAACWCLLGRKSKGSGRRQAVRDRILVVVAPGELIAVWVEHRVL